MTARVHAAAQPLEAQFAEAFAAQDWRRAKTIAAELERASNTVESITIDSLLKQWSEAGPLVHEPTGIAELDRLTDGGPVYGTRWYLLGAPDAGKTLFLIQLAHAYLDRGIAVGLLGVDEEPGDLLMRLAQRKGFSRRQCEERSQETLVGIHAALGSARLRFYDSTWTIDRAGEDLASFAEQHGARAALFIDSIQTVSCEGEDSQRSVREAVTARALAVRSVAQRFQMIVMSTSEMNRGAYRSTDAAEHTDDLASAKESGAIEFSARVMLALRSVKDDADLIELRIAKNKHGPRGERLYLQLDRARQELTEAEAPEVPDYEEAKAARARSKIVEAAAAVALELAHNPGLTLRKIRAAVSVRLSGCSRDRCDEGITCLASAVQTRPGARGARNHYLDGGMVPAEVLASLDPANRVAVGTSKLPEEESEC